MPEPVEQLGNVPAEEARRRLGIPAADLLITLVGSIDERKGAVELASGFLRADVPAGVHLAFIGSIDTETGRLLELLAAEDQRIHIVDRHLNAQDWWLAMCAGDVVGAPYPRHVGSSGIVARAAYLGRPLLASDFGWVGEATRRYGLGITVDATDPDDIARGIERLTSSEPPSTRSEQSAEYVQFNTAERFTSLWMQGILEVL